MSKPETIVAAIVRDLTDRRGLRQAWEGIDEDVRSEIVGSWIDIVARGQAMNDDKKKLVFLASPNVGPSTRLMDSIYKEVAKKEASMVNQVMREACELFRCGPEDLARSFEGAKLILYGPQHEDGSPRLVIARIWVDTEGHSIVIKVDKAKGLGE